MKKLCVYCGSRFGIDPMFAAAAVATGTACARKGIGVVYGGGNVGLMGTVADAALAAGGKVFGVIPRFMVERELAHPGLTQIDIVTTMHERKQRMAELSDAFLALPGGIGTLEELTEIVTWGYLDIHRKPIGLLNLDGFYDPLLQMLETMDDKGFLPENFMRFLCVGENIDSLIDTLLGE